MFINIYMYIYMYMYIYIYIYIYMCVCGCVCVCVCVWCVFLCVGVCVCVCDRVGVLCVWEGEEGGSGGGGDGGWVVVVFVVPSAVSLRITEAQQLHQVKRMIGGIGTCCSRPILKLEICKIQWLLSVNLSEARDNPMCIFR